MSKKKKKGYRAEELAKKTIRVESISQGRFAIIDADTGEILDDAIYDDDKHAERKRQDMNNRLNKIYEEIYNIE